mmetsp:Transcript_22608/g.59684  ORF Transcript_22608/g.59684 Transcript_22608/m.59684 type:complete len:182 (+) Transcript_22608:549-1094(+)
MWSMCPIRSLRRTPRNTWHNRCRASAPRFSLPSGSDGFQVRRTAQGVVTLEVPSTQFAISVSLGQSCKAWNQRNAVRLRLHLPHRLLQLLLAARVATGHRAQRRLVRAVTLQVARVDGVARVQTIALEIAPELGAPPSPCDLFEDALFKDAETFGVRSSGIDDPKVCIKALVRCTHFGDWH